ncbi:putative TOS1-like glycosyl hydrolase-domain-containing protein [Dipodascopsis uninucleata]
MRVASTGLLATALLFCQSVAADGAVFYDNVGFSGSYQAVTGMSSSDCTCSMSSSSFSGGLAPLDEEVSVHIRGPVQLKQFAAFTSSGVSLKKREAAPALKKNKHKHKHRRDLHMHEKIHKVTKRAYEYVTQVVTQYTTVFVEDTAAETPAPIPTTSSISTSAASPSHAAPISVVGNLIDDDQSSISSSFIVTTTAASDPSTPTTSSAYDYSSSSSVTSSSAQSSSPVSVKSSSSGSVSGSFGQVAYYNAESGSASGITFMNNLGGSNGSGVFSSCFGNSLSFANADGKTSCSSPQVLGDVLIPSDYEVILFSDSQCSGDSCGYYLDGIPAYQGFSGDYRVFLFEFQMPTDTTSGAPYNLDMPAIWFLNAKIPRTAQYGSCSCWDSGCGEFDAFEVLATGSSELTNHLHTWQGTGNQYGGGGASYSFTRPTDSTMKAAVVFDAISNVIAIVEVDSGFDFGSISASDVEGWLLTSGTSVTISS